MTHQVPFVIFDFDNCLAPGQAVGESTLSPLFEKIYQLEKRNLSSLNFDEMKLDFWRKPLDTIVNKFNLSEQTSQICFEYFSHLEIKKTISGYADTDLIHNLVADKVLVTSGFEKFQRSKIKGLGIDTAFLDIYFDDPSSQPRKGKAYYFELICRKYKKQIRDVWVIGDSADSEIAAGNSLGMKTVQILRPGVSKHGSAQYHVVDLAEFSKLIGDTQ